MVLDTSNSLGGLERPLEVVEILTPLAACRHFKEVGVERVDTRMGFHVSGRELGKGIVPAAKVIEAVRTRSRHRPNVILEQWPPFLGTIDSSIANEQAWAETGVRYLRGLLA